MREPAASCNEASPRARVSVMTDYRGINSLFNQQTACPACRLSNKIWRPCPGAKRAEFLPPSHRSPLLPFFRTRRGTRHRARASQDALRIPRQPSSIGRPRSVISLFAESLMSISRDTRHATTLGGRASGALPLAETFRTLLFFFSFSPSLPPLFATIADLSLERLTPKTTFV